MDNFLCRIPAAILGPLWPCRQPQAAHSVPQPVDLDRIERLLRQAMRGGVDAEMASTLNWFAQNGDRIEYALVEWLDLIETLMQNAEDRYGHARKLGPVKLAEVKRVLRFLMRNQEIVPASVPAPLKTMMSDMVLDFLISLLVDSANQYSLWGQPGEASGSFADWVLITTARIRLIMGTMLTPLAYLMGAAYSVYSRVRDSFISITPSVRSAMLAVQKSGFPLTSENCLSGAVQLIEWMAEHRQQVTAIYQLCMLAAQQAGRFMTLDTAGKKEYGTDLVMSVLNQLGFVENYGLFPMLVRCMVGVGVASAMQQFDKRHGWSASPVDLPAATPAAP